MSGAARTIGRAARAVRVGFERRGLGYARTVLADHVVPAAMYHALQPLPARWRGAVLARAPGTTRAAVEDRCAGRGLPLSATDRAAIPAHAVDDLVAQVEALHRSAIAGVDGALDRVAFDAATGRLAFADLKDARQYPSRRSLAFAHRRDLDRCALNARFGLSLWTEASVRAALADLRAAILDAWDTDYAPIDFGMGLSVGTFAKTDSGTGRWDCFNGPVLAPLVAGKRVIDLGCNNGAMPIMMLRSGAVEVVGVERNPDLARAARLVCEIAAWRDVAPYRFEIRQDDMRAFASGACGRFDVVTAYCSLYYLPHDQMVEVARVARAMHAQLVLQGNTAFGGDGTAEGLAAVMREAGYRDPSIVRFKGFGRPLVIGDRNL